MQVQCMKQSIRSWCSGTTQRDGVGREVGGGFRRGEELTHWESPWCWERLKVGGEGRIENEMVGWHR